jgi:hypothetical protein
MQYWRVVTELLIWLFDVMCCNRTAYYVLGMLASSKLGADILLSFEWESVRHARDRLDNTGNLADDCSWTVLGSLSDVSNASVSRDQQQASFVVACDNEVSYSFAWRPKQNNLSSSPISSTQTADTHATWPRSILPSVREGFGDDSDHAEGFAATENDLAISVPDEMNLKLSFGSAGRSSSLVDDRWTFLVNDKQELKYESVDMEYCTKSAETFQNVMSAQNDVPSTVCTVNGPDISSRQFSQQENCGVQPPAVSHNRSFAGFPVRSSLTLPHMLCHDAAGQEHDLEQQKRAKHPVSVQDLSGYLKLRDLHPPTMADWSSYMPYEYLTHCNDAESYRTKSLDLRVSRLRFVAVSVLTICVLYVFFSIFTLYEALRSIARQYTYTSASFLVLFFVYATFMHLAMLGGHGVFSGKAFGLTEWILSARK